MASCKLCGGTHIQTNVELEAIGLDWWAPTLTSSEERLEWEIQMTIEQIDKLIGRIDGN